MSPNKLYDALILGGGPAGLSVALGLARQNRTCLVISHNIFRNDGIEASHAVLGHDHIHPQKIWAKGREQIARYGNTDYAEAEIVSAEKTTIRQWDNREGLQLRGSEGKTWTGKTLVLAAGVKDKSPGLEGYGENWPRNIYQCLFCDGWERRQSQKAILCLNGITAKELNLASMALGLNTDRNSNGQASVTILTNGPFSTDNIVSDVSKRIKALQVRGVQIEQRKVIKLEDAAPNREGVCVYLQSENGDMERKLFGYLVHKPSTELNIPHIIEELGVTTENGIFGPVIKLSSMMSNTSVPGIFAAGDCANVLTHVTSAMVSVVSAAAGIVHYLNEKDDDAALESVSIQDPPEIAPVEGTGCYAA